MQALTIWIEKNTQKSMLPSLGLILVSWSIATSVPAWAESPTKASATAPAKAKSKLNAQIYEKEDPNESFTDNVDLVRDMAGEQQVLFKTHKGFYRIPEGNSKMQARLVKALKNHLPVSIRADSDSKMLQDVNFDGM